MSMSEPRGYESDAAFRNHLIQLEQRAQEAYDKYLVAMSTGALGLSFAFTRDLLEAHQAAGIGFLYVSWVGWAVALGLSLASFYVSTLAIRRAIERFDSSGSVDSGFDIAVTVLNPAAGIFFLCGVISFVAFAIANT
jgi:hypothetical protein